MPKVLTLLFILSTLLSGCGVFILEEIYNNDEPQETELHSSSGPRKIGPIAPACEPEDKVTEGRVVQEGEVTLKRHSQRVIRYGCDEKGELSHEVIKSDSWEEVEKPRTVYDIYPKNVESDQIKDRDKVRAKAFNKSTCSEDYNEKALEAFITGGLNLIPDILSHLFGGDDKPKLPLEIDYANHAFDMRVKEGLNYIDYSFYELCEQNDAECNEDGKKTLEEGTFILNVVYDLKEKGIIKEIKYIDDCHPEEEKAQ